MYIAILDFRTAASDRAAALRQLDREREEVRTMPGNMAFRAFASRENEADVTVLHEWEDVVAFKAYLGSGAFARSGEVIRPLMTDAPMSRRFRADLEEAIR
ncbi:putative quinol monooxygenase [Pseudactinotalea sp.]|uniref:putative quinol monooxygenase n=1 Tax=Pseudactinotalea sp. TaxID=1926260 RepID=UPI003B3AC6F3